MITCTQAFDQFAKQILPPDLTDGALLRFQALARLRLMSKDHSMDFGEAEQEIVYVARGAVKLVAHASEARDQIVAFHFPGEIFTVPEPENYSYSVCALKECEILTFSSSEFLTSAASEAGVLRHLLDFTTVSLRRCREKAIALGRKTASERIAVFLLGMADRIGVEQDERFYLDLPMSRRDIAESLGLTIETVSRELTKLRDEGAIETAGRSTVVLLKTFVLKRRAGFLHEAA